MATLPLLYPALPVLWVGFPSTSSPIISFFAILSSDIIRYCLCCSGEPITLISSSILVNVVTMLCNVSLQIVLLVSVAPVDTSLICSVGSLISCQLPGLLTSGVFLIAAVSHDFLCCRWMCCCLALHCFSFIMLNKTYWFYSNSLLLYNNSVTFIDNTQLSLYIGYKRKVSSLSLSSYSIISKFSCIHTLRFSVWVLFT
jgi:hypothetical protein